MSSYLNIYLQPKKSRKTYGFDNEGVHTEKTVELSQGLPMLLISYSRSSDIYTAFNDSLNPVYAGMETAYTELTESKCKSVIAYIEDDVAKAEKRLEIDYKILKEAGYNSELSDDIHSIEEYVREQKECINSIRGIYDIVYDCEEGYCDFEKVLINIT